MHDLTPTQPTIQNGFALRRISVFVPVKTKVQQQIKGMDSSGTNDLLPYQNLVLIQKIFNSYFRVSVNNDTVNNFERNLTCKFLFPRPKVAFFIWINFPAAHPEFPRGNQPLRGQRQPIIWPFFSENCMKTKKFWPGGGGMRPFPFLRQCFPKYGKMSFKLLMVSFPSKPWYKNWNLLDKY